MKVFYSPHSPFVRKVLVVAHEVGLFDRIELLTSAAGPVNRDAHIVASNPLGQVPTFFTDDGTMLADSRVVCEYLNDLAKASVYPVSGERRFAVLTEHSLADGLLNSALLARYERILRPAEKQWDDWYEGQFAKVRSVIDYFDSAAATLEGRVDIATITLACALAYLDHRYPDYDWRTGRDALAAWHRRFSDRPSMQDTKYGVDRMAAA